MSIEIFFQEAPNQRWERITWQPKIDSPAERKGVQITRHYPLEPTQLMRELLQDSSEHHPVKVFCIVGSQQHRTWERLEKSQEGGENFGEWNSGHRTPPVVEASILDGQACLFCCALSHRTKGHGVGVIGCIPTDR